MRILGIETATAVCSAALVLDGIVEAESLLDAGRVHSEKLMSQIIAVLGPAGLGPLGGVAVSIGPGSFTGLRIGVSVAKGIAFARGIPLVGVPTLEAIAFHAAATDRLAEGTPVLAALDARRDEVYCQLFTVTDGRPVPLREARAMTLGELAGEMQGAAAVVTGEAAPKILSWPGVSPGLRAASAQGLLASGGTVGLLGGNLLDAGKADDPAALEPRYIKEFFFKTR